MYASNQYQEHPQFNLQQQVMYCETHNGHTITHLCCLEDCLQPICGKCIKPHTQMHRETNTYAEMETIEDIKIFCQEKLMKSRTMHQQELENIQKISSQLIQTPKKRYQIKEEIRQIKVVILQCVQSYFDKMDKQVEDVEQQIHIQNEVKLNQNNIQQIFDELKTLGDRFNQGFYNIQLLKQVLVKNYSDDLGQNIQELQQNINLLQKKQQNLICDQSCQQKTMDFLSQICYFQNGETQKKSRPITPQKKYQNIFDNVPLLSQSQFQPSDNYNIQLGQQQHSESQEQLDQISKQQQQTINIIHSNISSNNMLNNQQQELNILNKQKYENQNINQKNQELPQNIQNNHPYQSQFTTPREQGEYLGKKFENTQITEVEFSKLNGRANQQNLEPLSTYKNLRDDNQNQILQQQQYLINNAAGCEYRNEDQQLDNNLEHEGEFMNQKTPYSAEFKDIIDNAVVPNPYYESQIRDFQITQPSYFQEDSTRKFLHFFQFKSKMFYFVNMEDLQRDYSPKFFSMELNINFKIPRWHKSIALPNGDIILTGGVSCENKNKKLSQVYKLDHISKSLVPLANMNLARSGHALVYLKDELYAIGGFSEFQTYTSKCEKYNFKTNKWTDIEDLNQRAYNPSACNFNNEFIYKFGGKYDDFLLSKLVEKYDPLINKWEVIQFHCSSTLTSNMTLLNLACCSQINSQQIIVFGGTYEDYSHKSNTSYIFNVGTQSIDTQNRQTRSSFTTYNISKFGDKLLPYKDGFQENQGIVHHGKLYCLQNVSSESQKSIVYVDRKRILRFDSYTWQALNDFDLRQMERSTLPQQNY